MVLTQNPTENLERAPSSMSRVVSIGSHLLIFGVVLVAGRHAWKARPITTRGGAHATLLYWKGGVGAGTVKTHNPGRSNLSPVKKTPHATPLPQQQKASLSQPAARPTPAVSPSSVGNSNSPSQLNGSGSGAQNATPAFPTYSPNPPVQDRSLLPQSETNVVVDVDVSAQGEVVDEKLIRGLGNGIDQAILDTVKGWKFHPATVDGNPVASVSELVFPMSQRYRG
jgi:TonB family protein